MACKKGLLREEQKYRNGFSAAAAAPSVAVSDALLFATMCIIGLPVDVHAKDGSVYSGIFHTASVDNDYAIVLKKAKMIKKGNQEANIVIGNLIETLIVQSEDLVQVVAKGIRLPSNGITGNVGVHGIGAIAGHYGCLDRDAKEIKPKESKSHRKQKSQKRFLAKRENSYVCSTTSETEKTLGGLSEEHNGRLGEAKFVKMEESQNISLLERQVGYDGSQEIQSNGQNSPQLQIERTADDVQGSNLSSASCESHSTTDVNILKETNIQQILENQGRVTPEETKCTVASPTNVSVATVPIPDTNSGSFLNASSNSFVPLHLENTTFKKSAKESKLNPGAKVFSPSVLHHRSVTPPAVPSGGTGSYMPDTYMLGPITNAQQEIDASSFARSSTPAKFVSYNNVASGNGSNGAPYIQPVIAQMVNRTQPVRYANQHHNFQTGAAYVHPNPQNAVFGRVGPLVCMHPVSSDAVQSAAGFPPATTRSLLTPHQVYLPKHQGNASAQALQLCMTPQIMASGPQPFVMPGSIGVSPPLFPVLRPIPVPGTNGFLSAKFA